MNLPGSHSTACCSMSKACLGSLIVDIGASDHMTYNHALFSQHTIPPRPTFVTLPNGTSKPVSQIGQVNLTSNLSLHKVLYVPDFKFNLLSASQLVTHNDTCVMFFPNTCVFQDLSTKRIVAVAPKQGGLYKFDPLAVGKTKSNFYIPYNSKPDAVYCNKSTLSFPTNNIACNVSSLDMLHARLRHTSL